MCGFAGVIAWQEPWRVNLDHLQRLGALLAHRGPDAEGFHFSDTGRGVHVALVHRRLAVLDPDPRADQPFTDGNGRWVVYNGEIYNFRELRRQLRYPWRTECDTEVLLAAYVQWGWRCVEHFSGMFAFALWDGPGRELVLARDRMGQKPLYWTSSADGGIAFASELQALVCVPWVHRETDPAALADYLRWGYIPAPATIYRDVRKLSPATVLRASSQAMHEARYFDPNAAASSPADQAATVARTRELVCSAVREQLVSDVPLGCFLSGGIDSSVIAAAMVSAAGSGQEVMTFSIGFDDSRYDETAHAARVARHLGTRHRQSIVRPDAAADLPRLAAAFGEPFADSSALPTHYLSRQTRAHVTVALSGDGGDELFGGYDRYRAMWLGEGFARLPRRLQQIAASKLWGRLPGSHPKSLPARAKRLLASLRLPPPQRYDEYVRVFDEPTLQSLWGDVPGDADRWAEQFELLMEQSDPVRAAMALDRVTYLPGDLLAKVDACSMLHALEVRSPFMDHPLVHFAAALSIEQLFGHGLNPAAFMGAPAPAPCKRLLREAFKADLPAEVFRRRKMGFAVPIGEWFRQGLREMLRDSLLSQQSFSTSHFDPAALRRLLDEHHSQRADHSHRLYALLMLELWHRLPSTSVDRSV